MSSVDLHRCLIAAAGVTLCGGGVWLFIAGDVRPVCENTRSTPVAVAAAPVVTTPRASLLFVDAVEPLDDELIVPAGTAARADFSPDETTFSRAEDTVILAGFEQSELSGRDAPAVEPVLFTGQIEVDEPGP